MVKVFSSQILKMFYPKKIDLKNKIENKFFFSDRVKTIYILE
jgi:hypothetical protein